MKLRPFAAPPRMPRNGKSAGTVVPGSVNGNRQLVVGRAGPSRNGMPGQNLYILRCQRAGCGHTYCEEGIRVHERRCPVCDGGKPGAAVPEREATLFD